MLDVFPSPVTPTDQGLALAELARRHPDPAESLEDAAGLELVVEPIRIASIEIVPLEGVESGLERETRQ
jgi:hypothetical protein